MEREGRRDEFSRVLVKAPEVSRFQLVIACDVMWQVMTVSELEAMIRRRGPLANKFLVGTVLVKLITDLIEQIWVVETPGPRETPGYPPSRTPKGPVVSLQARGSPGAPKKRGRVLR